MSGRDPIQSLEQVVAAAAVPFVGAGVEIREIVAVTDDGRIAWISDPADAEAPAQRALSTQALRSEHIGMRAIVAFERGQPSRPVVLGVLSGVVKGPDCDGSDRLQLTADDERIVLCARSQIVFRCGKASITLTAAGKVLIEGAYVSSKSSGVNRLKGGAVQIN